MSYFRKYKYSSTMHLEQTAESTRVQCISRAYLGPSWMINCRNCSGAPPQPLWLALQSLVSEGRWPFFRSIMDWIHPWAFLHWTTGGTLYDLSTPILNSSYSLCGRRIPNVSHPSVQVMSCSTPVSHPPGCPHLPFCVEFNSRSSAWSYTITFARVTLKTSSVAPRTLADCPTLT